MNSIDKLCEMLESKNQESSETVSELENLQVMLENPLNYTSDSISKLKDILSLENKLDEKELEFLFKFANLSEITKKYFLSNGLKDSERSILDSIDKRIKNSILHYKSNNVSKINIKELLSKLKKRSNEFITQEEINYILKIIKDELKTSEKIEILIEIDKYNQVLFSNYGLSSNLPHDIDEAELIETNIEIDKIKELLNEFGIDISKFKDIELNKLSKYGDLGKMRDILDLLSKEKIIGDNNIKLSSEILTKTLIYSSARNILSVKEKNDVDFRELVRKIPTVLFPTVKESGKKKGGTGEWTIGSSGAMNNYIKNSELLESLDIPFEAVWRNCFSFFSHSNKTIVGNISDLELYGIPLVRNDNGINNVFSALKYLNVIDAYDVALESNAKEYALNNLSAISPHLSYKFGMIKLANKMGLSEEQIFGYYTTPIRKPFLKEKTLKNHFIPMALEEIYKEYDAVSINIPNKSIYDNIFDITDNWQIPASIFDDSNIRALEKFSESDDLYNFNGTKISKKKVLRRYTALKLNGKDNDMSSIMYCIIYGSMLDEKDFENIYSLVKESVLFKPDPDIYVSRKYVDDALEKKASLRLEGN